MRLSVQKSSVSRAIRGDIGLFLRAFLFWIGVLFAMFVVLGAVAVPLSVAILVGRSYYVWQNRFAKSRAEQGSLQ